MNLCSWLVSLCVVYRLQSTNTESQHSTCEYESNVTCPTVVQHFLSTYIVVWYFFILGLCQVPTTQQGNNVIFFLVLVLLEMIFISFNIFIYLLNNLISFSYMPTKPHGSTKIKISRLIHSQIFIFHKIFVYLLFLLLPTK